MGKKKGGKRLGKKQVSELLQNLFQHNPNETFTFRQIFKALKFDTHPLKMLAIDTMEEMAWVIDTHTAVAAAVYEKYQAETKDATKTVIASTASPFKFTRSVMNAIDGKYDAMTDFELVDELSRLANVKVPNAIEEIRTAPVVHDKQCDVDEMKKVVCEFLGI